ncbi:hypothetical protein PI125_g21252 [Phytophthora idaei]|nr:hypothetical protein PI125_g21252 [Phytophthora idaei]
MVAGGVWFFSNVRVAGCLRRKQTRARGRSHSDITQMKKFHSMSNKLRCITDVRRLLTAAAAEGQSLRDHLEQN